jgi:ATP-dependent Clp protease ATP-binding subunit ClpA
MTGTRSPKDARASLLAAGADEARASGQEAVEAEHLLLALADHPDLRDLGFDRNRLVAALSAEEEWSLAVVGVFAEEFDLSATARRARKTKLATSAKLALHRAARVAVRRGDRRVTAHHLLAGVLAAEHGRVPRTLQIAGIDIEKLRTQA